MNAVTSVAKKHVIFISLLWGFGISQTGGAVQDYRPGTVEIESAPSKAQTQQNIDQMRAKIKAANKQLQKLNAVASSTERQLGQAQKALSINQKQQRQTQAKSQALKDDVRKTNSDIEEAQAQMVQHQLWIKTQLQNTYKHGQDSSLKLVLSGDSPSDTARLLKYHQQIHFARQTRMQMIQDDQNELNTLQKLQTLHQQELKAQEQKLAALNRQQTSLQTRLTQSKNQAHSSISKTKLSLQQMQKRASVLETLLQDLIIQEEIDDASQQGFANLKGKLPLPFEGKLKSSFNTPKLDGIGTWQGIWILPGQTKSQDVKSIAEGHIVFADWLLGYGLLTIVDHGQGFFSLYGHSTALLKQPGDWVSTRTTIATFNPDEISTMPIKGLYFEIRENSQALNPLSWLKPIRH